MYLLAFFPAYVCVLYTAHSAEYAYVLTDSAPQPTILSQNKYKSTVTHENILAGFYITATVHYNTVEVGKGGGIGDKCFIVFF